VTAIAARVGGIRWTHPKTIGIVGIFLGLLAFWLTLPPVHARTVLFPIFIGILAIACGIWAQARDEKRVGWGAVAAGFLGIGFGMLATNSSVANLDTVVVWSALGAASIIYATPL
jgi:simple sugar transport system permease protein